MIRRVAVLACGLMIVCLVGSAGAGTTTGWLVDFDNGGNQDGGNHTEAGYQPYTANHEVAADFTRQEFVANFAISGNTNVALTPTWPDTTDNRVQQMIDRGATHDANWQGLKLDLLTDFIGIDTRTGNGGNGNFDGATGVPTRMLLTLEGLPAGNYTYIGYHHDTENIHTPFLLGVSTDGSSAFTNIASSEMTNASPGSNPPSTNEDNGAGGLDPILLDSTIFFNFDADGTNDVVLEYIPLARTAVHEQILGVNGFEIYQNSVIPEPASFGMLAISGLMLLGFGRRRRN